ncbi:flagellar biosynthetic protein FliO [Acetoanaerobium sticklandii]|uniref:flagellar biosynthetic protein FliO n=1 Tax=Acetoanaerobium sticklandii TaxID=1511 RepID=UPI00059DA7E7
MFLEILRIIVSLGIFIAILFGAKYATVYWAKRNHFINQEKQIKIVEQVPLARDKAIFLVKYKNNEYLIATTQQNVEIIDRIKTEEMDNYGN